MKVSIDSRPAYAVATAELAPNEAIQAEAGSMVAMSSDMQIQTSTRGGLFGSLKRSLLGGESFFMNTYRASEAGGRVMLAPPLPGDMSVEEVGGWGGLLVQSGSYVASSEGVGVDTGWGGAKTFFASEGLFMLKIGGQGTLILSSYGAIKEVELAAGESFTVDTGHLVAFPENVAFNVRRVGGLKSTIFSGEGLVVDLTGPGRILLQTRSEDSFLSWLIPQLPKDNGR